MNHLMVFLLTLSSLIAFTLSVSVNIVKIDDYDPGCCNKTNAFQVYSVKDRNDKTKFWICSKEDEKYLWKPFDVTSTEKAFVGEYLNPGYDCSDILNREENVQDGYYWINLGGSNKRKVWCDMTTDGGGFLLVARKQNGTTWDVPSKDKPVSPSMKDKYWTSQLGDLPILDFRVQMSTSDSFDDTKAHWYFRLKNKRVLGKLMINDRGCSNLEPGIGDIAYVKELITEKIVSTSFQCSVFGSLQSSGKIGWSMMNECLKTPCSGSGFIHQKDVPLIALDHSGVFSFSASSNKSGMIYDSTAFVGCVNKKCCGCYGPKGGTGNYCNAYCNTSNGGTIVDAKNVYIWIWVRSTHPKRVWNKCMEYQSEDELGQMQWYILKGDSVIPEKGRCKKREKLRLNSGIVFVPDNVAAKKVPKIPGLLEYRLDQKKLYVRANKTWKQVNQEEQVKEKLVNLEQNFEKKSEKLKEMIEAINVTLRETIAKLEAENAKLKTKLVFSQPSYENVTSVCGGEYKWLNESTRTYNYRSNRYCDSSLSGWYRFGGSAGTMMFSGCIRGRSRRCGTNYPGHLTGGHPGVNDGIVSRVVCFSYRDSYDEYCCYYRRTIKVLNCGTFYVYKLNGTPTCNLRYCSSE